MSYTLIIDEPKAAAWLEETSRTMTPSELGALFVVFLRERMSRSKTSADSVSTRLESFVRGLPKLKGEPYRFRRADAYDTASAPSIRSRRPAHDLILHS